MIISLRRLHMTEAQKILRKRERALAKELGAKRWEPYNVFLGDSLVRR
jgi:hypothetical protein